MTRQRNVDWQCEKNLDCVGHFYLDFYSDKHEVSQFSVHWCIDILGQNVII
jgi:hypothetical protein